MNGPSFAPTLFRCVCVKSVLVPQRKEPVIQELLALRVISLLPQAHSRCARRTARGGSKYTHFLGASLPGRSTSMGHKAGYVKSDVCGRQTEVCGSPTGTSSTLANSPLLSYWLISFHLHALSLSCSLSPSLSPCHFSFISQISSRVSWLRLGLMPLLGKFFFLNKFLTCDTSPGPSRQFNRCCTAFNSS